MHRWRESADIFTEMHRQIILKKQINIFRRFWHRTRTGVSVPKEYKDIAPEHNEGIYLVPQIMANNAEVFLKAVQELEQLGYQEVNLNLGCPSRTVVTKYRGAGFLAKPDALEQFLEEGVW